jgi:glutamyl-Q tRNA(Asp) synthetase
VRLTPDIPDSRPVFRFAPSPNGYLHLGHALSALTGFDMARRMGGRFLVRIEDIDLSRARPVYVQAIFEDLAWLGIQWEEPVLRQSEHFPVYRAAAGRLAELGLLYRCWATRSELARAAADMRAGVDPDGAPLVWRSRHLLSPEEERRRLERGDPFVLRLDMQAAIRLAHQRLGNACLSFTELAADGSARSITAHPELWGDVVIARKDVPTSYHLSVVVDDARQGVTHVTRGQDLLAATDVHRLLQVILDLPEPRYHHHRLITDEAGRKLAKSARDTSLRSLRAAGVTAEDVRRLISLPEA